MFIFPGPILIYMDVKTISVLIAFFAVFIATGCTGSQGPPGTEIPAAPAPVPQITTTPADGTRCISYADCVPATCCHPSGCTNKAKAPDCSAKLCTMSCEGPIDCGAGSCGCVDGTCAVVPALSGTAAAAQPVRLNLDVSPQQYSPFMSSTPGIRLSVNATGPAPSDAQFRWSASYGHFLSWNAPDFRVTGLGNPYMNSGETIYWAFIEKPASTKEPVVVTVTAKDGKTGAVLGISTVILDWDGDYAVHVREIR